MSQIDDIYIQKISDIARIPYSHVIALRDIGIFDNRAVRDILIKHDYYKLKKTNKFTDNQIFEKLSGIYNVSKGTTKSAIREKHRFNYFCKQCGAKVLRSIYLNNKGLCDRCYASQIKT